MPVFSTQGALAFERVPFADFKGWYANSVGDFDFNDFDFSDSGANIHLATGDKTSSPGNVRFGYSRIDNSGLLPNVTLTRTYGSGNIIGVNQQSESFAVSYGGNISAPQVIHGGYLFGNTPGFGNVFNKFTVVGNTLPVGYISSSSSNSYNTINNIESIGNNVSYLSGVTTVSSSNTNSNNHAVFFSQVNTVNGSLSNTRFLTSVADSYIGDLNKTIPGDLQVDSGGNVILTYNIQQSNTDPSLNQKISGLGKLYANLVNNWGITIYNSTFTTTIADAATDSNNNVYAVVYTDSAYKSYVLKASAAGSLQYNQNLSNVNLTCVAADQYNNIYIAGNDNLNRIYIAELDSSGNIVWQNFLTDSASTYSVTNLRVYNNFLYLSGNQSNKGFLAKVPYNGSRPGNGVYGSITYGLSNASMSSSTDLIATFNSGSGTYPSRNAAITNNANANAVVTGVTIMSINNTAIT